MTHPVPEAVPATLRAGDTATWRRNPADYPASDGWSMDYILVTAAAQIAIAASVAGNEFLVEVSPATTALWTAGRYAWRIHEEKGKTWFKRGKGTIAKGERADEKFIERALKDNADKIREIAESQVEKAIQEANR